MATSSFRALSVGKHWLPVSRGACRQRYRYLSRCIAQPRSLSNVPASATFHFSLPPPSLAFPVPSTWASRVVASAASRSAVRGVRTAAPGHWCKDVNLDSENPFYEKYKETLETLEGFSKQQTRAKIKAARLQEKSRETAFRPPSRPTSQHSFLRPPSLDSVIHTGMIAGKTAEEIGEIWREYYKTQDAICAIIPANTYVELITKALHCPYFVYPLPREEGHEFIFGQFSGHRCHFTSLINYQQYQENAPGCLSLTHYIDLQHSKGIVLMAGEVDTSYLTTLEAQYLANQVQLYYGSHDETRYTLLRKFNHDPETFDHSKLLEQLQNISISMPVNSTTQQN